MATSVIFDLIDTLVTRSITALPAVLVCDGTGATDNPGDFLMIGVEDPDVDGFAESADAQQSWAGLGARARDEVGSISCCALSWNGDSGNAGQKSARDAVQAIVATIETMLRDDPDLADAVTGLMWTGFGERMTLRQIQDKDGSAAMAFFQIAFKARI